MNKVETEDIKVIQYSFVSRSCALRTLCRKFQSAREIPLRNSSV